MKTNITASTIKRMNYQNLQKLCAKKGIEFKGQSRQKLVDLLLTKLGSLENDIPEAETVEHVPQVNGTEQREVKAPKLKQRVTAKSKAIKKPAPEKKPKKAQGDTKSSKILALYLKGKSVAEISKELKAHKSFCYTVIGKHKNSKTKGN
jgi:predicted Zn-dependent peptidase